MWTTPADKLFMVVRNVSPKEICYCEPHTLNIKVYARQDSVSPWLELGLKTAPQNFVLVAICPGIALKPSEETPSYRLLSLDLREYRFPAEWSGSSEVKIVQPTVYCTQDNYKIGQVESPAVKIKLPSECRQSRRSVR